VKTLFYSLFIFVIALLVLISFFLGGFLGELKNVENICGDCKGGLSASGYQVCVGEYIVFECKGDGWTKAFEVKGRGQNLTIFLILVERINDAYRRIRKEVLCGY